MNRPQNSTRHIGRGFAPHWRGFTLIEMLVASALVVLMMTIFAEVFQMASGSMTLQRTIAENDQQVRTFTTIMRGDLQKRTFRNLIPFFPREDYALNGVPFDGREGYFYVAGNNPNSSSDTVLQFTADSRNISESADQTPYYGRSSLLAQLIQNPNQPESDDGQIQDNGASASAAAEISYFVRNGILYRRVVLLRQPISALTSNTSSDTIQPRATNGAPLFTSTSPHKYWQLFDHAAYRTPDANPNNRVPFLLGFDANSSVLDNKLKGFTDVPLGRSRFRFGFDNSHSANGATWGPTNGLSREYFGASNELFLGRFTHEETSHDDFRYPCVGSTAPGGNPFATGSTLLDADSDGIADLFEGGPRQGQDILLTHVHSFEVEMFDDRLQAFAPVGHSLTAAGGVPGDFSITRLLNGNYVATGQGITAGQTFDTWHPWYDRDGQGVGDSLPIPTPPIAPNQNYFSNDMLQDSPPYRPMTYDPTGYSAPFPPNSSSGPYDPSWNPGTNYVVGDIVFVPTEDVNYNGKLDNNEDTTGGMGSFKGYAHNNGNGDGLIDAIGNGSTISRPVQPYGRVYYYVCRRAAQNGATPAGYQDQPAWGTSPNQLFGHTNPDLPQWEAVLNLRPVRAMRMTVRFLHRGSNKLRQITLVHSLRNQ